MEIITTTDATTTHPGCIEKRRVKQLGNSNLVAFRMRGVFPGLCQLSGDTITTTIGSCIKNDLLRNCGS